MPQQGHTGQSKRVVLAGGLSSGQSCLSLVESLGGRVRSGENGQTVGQASPGEATRDQIEISGIQSLSGLAGHLNR